MVEISHPPMFKEGVRLLMRILRKKDGGPTATDRASRRYISTNPEEFDAHLAKLKSQLLPGERIYSSSGPRDLAKAIRKFRIRQVECETEENPHDFYLNIENRWLSCLASPECSDRAGRVWLLDIDEQRDEAFITGILTRLNIPILDDYRTTGGGRHIIVKPFNTAGFELPLSLVLKKDVLMLWAWEKAEQRVGDGVI